VIAWKFNPMLVKLGVPRKLRRAAIDNVAVLLVRVLDVTAMRTVKLARYYGTRAFKYRNPQPGSRPGTCVASFSYNPVRKSGNGLVVEMTSDVFYDDILENGPKTKRWEIKPTGKRKLISPIGPQMPGRKKYTKIKMLRWYVGGIAIYARKVVRNWTKASLRPHWAPAMQHEDPTFVQACADATIRGVEMAING
jgi:hypothetical protein